MKSPLERAVREIHARLVTSHTEYCSCAQCTDDVTALVMNQTRPRYTTTGLGWAVENVDLDSDQTRAALSVLVLDAMRRVAQEPRHPVGKPAEAGRGESTEG